MLTKIFEFRAKMLKKKELNYYRKEIIKSFSETGDDEIREIVDYLKLNNAQCLNYDFVNKVKEEDIFVYTDETGMLYVLRNNKRIFFPREWNEQQIKEYYKTILEEQNEKSPHRYLTQELSQKKYEIVIDVGGAEGIFALDILDNAKHIYIFEGDKIWIEPLKKTFCEYKNKVIIVEKFVSNFSNEQYVSIDSFFNNNEKVDLIKLDVEGAESLVLEGANNVINRNKDIIVLACAYHYQEEEDELRKMLSDYIILPRHGYMLFHWREKEKLKFPFLRRGVLEIRKSRRV